MAPALMRGAHILPGAKQISRRSWAGVPSPWMLLLCLALGYLLGCHHNRVQPYPLEEDAFIPPPHSLQQQQQQHPASADPTAAAPAGTPATAAATQAAVPADIKPPAIGGSSSDSSSSNSGSSSTEVLKADVLSHQLLSGSLLTQQRPPLTPGRSGNAFYTAAPFQVLSWYPRIILYPGFLTPSQTQHLISLAQHQLQPSELGVANVTFHPGAGRTDAQQVRNSHGVFLDRSSDPTGMLGWLEERIAAVTMIPPSHGEDFNVLRYSPGQHYNSHMDTFDPHYLSRTNPGFGQRMATFLMYLSDVEEGGETVFKHEGKYGALRQVSDLTNCTNGDFKVRPRAGDAILFWSLNHDLSVNPRALHGACPVVKGEKWVTTKWLHDKPITEWDGEAQR